MKLEYEVFPNFYKKYDWLAEEEEDDLFTGRKYYLENFWRNLSNLVNKDFSRQNRAFIGQRKMGKTAFLVRCYNLAFWEQDDVIPFYYCFSQTEKLNLRETASEIVFKFLKQAVGYITKDRELIEEKKETVLFYALKDKQHPWLKKLMMYWDINKQERETCEISLVLEKAWELVDIFSSVFNKKCLLIIDEYQKTVCDLIDSDRNSVACHQSIGKIINNRSIYTIISGSQISMIAYNVLTSEIRNRIPGEKFDLLIEKEAHELILEFADKKGYEGMEHDVYRLTGGNPYYIKILFTPTNKFFKYFGRSKKWQSKEDVEEIYNFEMLHMEGEVFQFWNNHINEKIHLLNNDPPKHKGATLRLLKFIAERDGEVHIEELKQKFPEIKDMRDRLRKLRETDLLLDSADSEHIMGFSDHVLPVVMTRMYQRIFLGNISKAAFDKYKEEWFQTLEERNNQHFQRIHKDISKLRDEIGKTEQEIKFLSSKIKTAKSNKGKANLAKGTKAQSKAAKAIESLFNKKQTIFSKDYELKQSLTSTNVKLASGRGSEVDFYGVLHAKNGAKPQEYALIGEVKHYKRGKIRKDAVQKFVDSIGLVKRDGKHKEAVVMFISKSGFKEDAIEILKRHKIIYGDLEEALTKISLPS